MAFLNAAHTGDMSRSIRLAALLILMIALTLCVWRASSLLTGAPATPRNADEASIYALVEPITGPGRMRLTLSPNAEGARTLFVLLDTQAAALSTDLQRILPEAAGLDLRAGDRLIIETAAFARGLPGRPDGAAWFELGGLGLICLIAGGIAAATLRPVSTHPLATSIAPAMPSHSALARRENASDDVIPLRTIPAQIDGEAAGLARKDPAQAAAVLRHWMQNRGDPQ